MNQTTKKTWSVGWLDRGMGHGSFGVIDDSGNLIAKVVTGLEEDALILAAGPKLLAACQDVVSQLRDHRTEHGFGISPQMRFLIDEAVDAISKAEPPIEKD